MANKVEICGVNTSKLPVYKDEQMKAMMEKIKQKTVKRLKKSKISLKMRLLW